MNKPKNCILYLVNQDMEDRNLERLGINFFLKKNWTIYIYNQNYNFKNIKKKNIIYLKEKNFLLILIKFYNISKSLNYFISFSGNSFKEKFIEKYLSFFKLKKIEFSLGLVPQPKKINRKIIGRLNFSNYKKIILFFFENIKYIILNKLFYFKPNLFFTSGKKSRPIGKKNISNHNFDYDEFIKIKNKIKKKKKEYYVFIDQYLENSYDLNNNNYYYKYNKNLYWRPLEIFFNLLKNKVIILTHPRRKIWNNKNLKKSKINKWELISNAKGIFSHDSTAVQIPILLKKPIIFLTSDYIEKDFLKKEHIKLFASETGADVINVDRYKEFEKLNFSINYKKYNKYIKNYIVQKKTNISTWEKLYKFFK